MKNIKILLINCEVKAPSRVSVGLTSIATHLLTKSIDVEIFDDAPYMLNMDDETQDPREKANLILKTDPTQLYNLPYANRYCDLLSLVNRFKPDLVGAYATEVTFNNAVKYLREIKKNDSTIKTILGGPFVMLCPDFAISPDVVDMVALGEGELILEEYCKRCQLGTNPTETKGLWIKEMDGSIRKNPPSSLVDINKIPSLRYDLYPIKRLNRPISGAVRRMLPLDLDRGCVYGCTYCSCPTLKSNFENFDIGSWYRKRDIINIDRDISTYVKLYDPEYFFITSDTFLSMTRKYFDDFIGMYKKYMIPFWMNTRPETIKDYHIGKLKDVGLERMSMGVECGNEVYRKKILGRKYSNSSLISAFDVFKKYNIKITTNVMLGLPGETRELIFDTIRLIKKLKPTNFGLVIYQPFRGTPLHKYCVDNKYYDPENLIDVTRYTPQIYNPHLTEKEILKLFYAFNLYIKMDESDWPVIDSIDMDTEEGINLFNKLIIEYPHSE